MCSPVQLGAARCSPVQPGAARQRNTELETDREHTTYTDWCVQVLSLKN